MSAAPTLKELVKAVGTFSRTPSLPLPEDLVQLIEKFLYSRTEKLDESTSEKVHDELLSIFKQDIAQEPKRYAAFLAILRRLRPLIGQPGKVLQWFELLLPVINHLNQEKHLAAECQGIVLDILTADDGNDTSSFAGGAALPVAEKMMDLWIKEVEILRNDPDALQEFKEQNMRETLLLYGKKRPKDFMLVVDKFVCKKLYRDSALMLLSAFVQSQPPHLYLILQTPLFGNLLSCLQKDTSTMVVSLALTSLTMVLPHIPSSLVPYLPTLFNIYARLLFWQRELSMHASAEENPESNVLPRNLNWEVCHFSAKVDDLTISQLPNYFTILYGLYPLNFTDYIRKPQRYLRHADAPDTDALEVQPTEIRHASERFRQCHLLHENFYTLTIDSEKTDFGRWIKKEPAEVVADCMALRQMIDEPPDTVPLELGSILPSDTGGSEMESNSSALLSSSADIGASNTCAPQGDDYRSPGSSTSPLTTTRSRASTTMARHSSQSSHQSNRDSLNIRLSENEHDSPSLSRQLTSSSSHTQLQDLVNSNKAVKSTLHQSLTNDSVPSLSLSQHEPTLERRSSHLLSTLPGPNAQSSATPASTDQHTKLIRYVYLLYNDLLFERFMKQQHLTHIGALRRRHVREAASEAETQNIITANKHLKQRLEEAKKSEIQAKTEAEKSRTLAKKWEADIFNKLKTLREEQKKWNTVESSLRAELEAVKAEAEQLRKLVCEVEVRELKLKRNMQSADIHFGEMERLRAEIERLTEIERNHQAKELEYQAAMTRAAEADSRAQAYAMKLAAVEIDFRHSHGMFKSQILELDAKLQQALRTSGEQEVKRLKAQLDAALEANRITQVQMKNRIDDLSRQKAKLENEMLELRSEIPLRVQPRDDLSTDSEDDHPPVSDAESPNYRRPHQRLSDPDMFKSGSYNATPPLESIGTPGRMANVQMRSPTLGDGLASPHRGRGGLQNNRKDKQEKKEDKDKKKSTSLRGIRGFM
ncbi:hypothetical protein F5Y17DRAFT_411000 [Xylariaceae sp. FL0594]|nr:hypothetical protein F5Y17DRAFT_411000 [Xylariaceae sp. FL0594]